MAAPSTRKTPAGDFDADWPVIIGYLDRSVRNPLLEGREASLSDLSGPEWMDLYTKSYNLATAKYLKDQANIYPSLVRYYFDIADKLIGDIASSDHEDKKATLIAYLEAYDRFLGGAILLLRMWRQYDSIRMAEWYKQWKGKPMPESEKERKKQPMRWAQIDQDIVQYDLATVEGTPVVPSIAKLAWPPEGMVVDSGDQAKDTKEKAQLEARKYAGFPMYVHAGLVPTMLRTWRAATVKHLGDDTDRSIPRMIAQLKEEGKIQDDQELMRRLVRCFWATGVEKTDSGFQDLIEMLKSEVGN